MDIDSMDDKDDSDGSPMMVFELHQIAIQSDHIRITRLTSWRLSIRKP
jgi:hypothetical protein